MAHMLHASLCHALPLRSRAVQHPRPALPRGLAGQRRSSALRPQRPFRLSTALAAGAIQEMSADELSVAIAERDRPLLIDFSADWCGPCRLLTTELEQVAKELGDKIKIIKIDTEKNMELSSQLRIEGLPTMVFVGMNKEKPALRTEGLLSAKNIVDIIQNELT